MRGVDEGQRAYQEWRANLVGTPEKRALYEEIAAKSDLWLQLVEAPQAAGLTQRVGLLQGPNPPPPSARVR